MRKLIRLLVLTSMLAVIAAVLLLSASVYTFARLTDETLIAEIRFERVGPRRHLAYLSTGDFCNESVFEIEGDQWRIDAEFVKWHYWANLLGFDSQYRLDRFEGRFSDVSEQNARRPSAHSLAPATAVDLVGLAQSLGQLNFLVDATYGSSTFQDIAVDSVYLVYKSPTGVFTRSRPASPPRAEDALAIEIRQACGSGPGAWESLALWADRAATVLLQPAASS